MAASNSRAAPSWESVVSVREEIPLGTELTARWVAASGLRGVGVTDLVSLRRAFYRVAAPPVPIPPDRQARLDQGRAVHRTLGLVLASEGTLEARVRRDGLVGRIDVLSDVPIEVKTTTTLVEPSSLATYRPDYIEQLAMYCGLLGGPNGRLVSLVAGPSGVSEVQAVDVAFRSPSGILSEMKERAARLRTAWKEGHADALPRCPWYGRGCEFEESRVCSCTGQEPPSAHPLTEEVERVVPREDVRARIRSALAGAPSSVETAPVGRYREILYPRRAYFEEVAPLPAAAEATPPRPLAPDLYARLSEAVESGPPGEVARIPSGTAGPDEEVLGFRGRPLLVRTSRAWARLRPEEVVRRAPQYVLELGLKCAVTGRDSGLVIVGFERAEADKDRIQALEFRFASLTPFSRMYRERSRALRSAVRDRTPGTLPACPAWMVEDCPYRAECGCGDVGGRETR